MMRLTNFLVALLVTFPALAGEEILARLAEPRTHAVMRHALAPGSGETENFDLFDCATQRNLSQDGVRQAQRAGDLVRKAGVQVDHVWSSFYCRCLDTARELELGPVERRSDLNFFGQDEGSNRRRTVAILKELAALPPGETAIVVTHSSNATALTGVRPLSGEIQVVRVTESGELELLGSVEVPVF